MQEIVLVIGLIAYSIFIIQFIMSLFGYDSDIDIDLDFDGDADFSVSDLVSFKGVIHFLMGSTTYIYSHLLSGGILTIYNWIIATLVGVVFTMGLYCIYRLCMKLKHTPQREEGDLGERYVNIIRQENGNIYIGSTHINGAYDIFTVESAKPLEIGKNYKITKFINNKIYI